MRKIGIVGGTGIENPDTLKGFETKIIETPYGKALCNIGERAETWWRSCPGTGWIIPWRPT